MAEMTPEETRRFLVDTPRTAKLATVRPDGRPHVTPVWFTLDGDEVVFTTWHTTVKAANLEHNPWVALCVDDEEPPYAYVILEGRATLNPAAEDLLHWTTRLAGRYMGAGLADSYGRRNAVPGEILVRVRVERTITQRGIAD